MFLTRAPGGKYDYALETTSLLIGFSGLFKPLRSYQGPVASRSYLLSLWSARDILEFWFSAPFHQNLRQNVLKWKHQVQRWYSQLNFYDYDLLKDSPKRCALITFARLRQSNQGFMIACCPLNCPVNGVIFFFVCLLVTGYFSKSVRF